MSARYCHELAVLVDRDDVERMCFMVEAKSSLFDEDLRARESGKIECGAAHFLALAVGENPLVESRISLIRLTSDNVHFSLLSTIDRPGDNN